MQIAAQVQPSSTSGALRHAADVRAYLAARRPELEAMLREPRSSGMQLAQRASDVMDGLLRDLFAAAQSGATGAHLPPVLLAAVGGYGRRLLGWKSDLDLRLLTAGEPEQVQSFAEAILYPLWDAGVSVGHQVITIEDVIEGAERDLPTATALLDLRPLAGDHALGARLRERAFASVFAPRKLPEFLRRLHVEARARRDRPDDSMLLLEPEIKNGAGGLREWDIALWAAGARWPSTDLDQLCRLGALQEREAEQVRRSLEFLWSVRNRLHRHAGRKSDRLTFAEQESIASELGYAAVLGDRSGTADHLAIDAIAAGFMSDYHRHSRTVARVSRQLFARAQPPQRESPQAIELGDGLRIVGDFVTCDDVARLKTDPALALRLIAAAVEHGRPLHERAHEAIEREASEAWFGAALRADPAAVRLFVQLVCDCRRARFRTDSILAQLHDVGLLTAMIPEFTALVGQAHHDVYHVYPVDVHSIAAVDKLRELVDDEPSSKYPLASRLAQDASERELLFFATLLHDLGKAVGERDHARRGARMARPILERLGFDPGSVDRACTLILEHLTMYRVAMRRDVSDPATLSDFARLIGDRRMLDALYLLTLVDVGTTSPSSLTTWKARMLEGLFVAVQPWLCAGDATQQPPAAPVRGRLSSLSAEFVDSMPERYLRSSTPQEILAHAELARAAHRTDVRVALVPSRHAEAVELCVVASDRTGLLAAIAAAIAANQLDVDAAEIYTRQLADGTTQAMDLFWVRDRCTGTDGVAARLPSLEQDLQNVVTGKIAPLELLRSRKGSRWSERPVPAVPTRVTLDHAAAPHHTVVEVVTRDRPGVLFTLAEAMHEIGLTIALAKVSTEGARAIDAFYVTEANGDKLDPQRSPQIEPSLLHAMEVASSYL